MKNEARNYFNSIENEESLFNDPDANDLFSYVLGNFGINITLIKSRTTGEYHFWPCLDGNEIEIFDKKSAKIFLDKLSKSYDELSDSDINRRKLITNRNLTRFKNTMNKRGIKINNEPYRTLDLGYIYFIKHLNLYKIGYSRHIKRRIRQLELEHDEMEIFAIFECDDPELAETILHKQFEKYRVYGEWFDLNRWKMMPYFWETYQKELDPMFTKLVWREINQSDLDGEI